VTTLSPLADRVAELERLQRERDREAGLLAAVDSGLSAVTHGMAALTEHQRKELAALRRDVADLRSAMVRLQALPLGGLAHLVAGQTQGDLQSPTAIGVALLVLLLTGASPELAKLLGRARRGASIPPPPPADDLNGSRGADRHA
jgi:hypothetical protein